MMKEISESIHSILAEQSLAYTLSLQCKGEPARESLDYYQKSIESRLRAPEAEDDSKMMIYQRALGEIVRAKLEAQGLPHR